MYYYGFDMTYVVLVLPCLIAVKSGVRHLITVPERWKMFPTSPIRVQPFRMIGSLIKYVPLGICTTLPPIVFA